MNIDRATQSDYFELCRLMALALSLRAQCDGAWGVLGVWADTEDGALRHLAKQVIERGDTTHLPDQLRIYCVEEIDSMILDLQNKRKALQ